jgi:hypothetical protein
MNLEYKEKSPIHFQPKVHVIHKILHMKTFVKPINVKIAMKIQIIKLNCALIMFFIANYIRTPSSMTINQGIHKMSFCNQNFTLDYQACFISKCYPYNM